MVLVDGKLFCYTKDPQFRAGVEETSHLWQDGWTQNYRPLPFIIYAPLHPNLSYIPPSQRGGTNTQTP
jgi:hypothetical protein